MRLETGSRLVMIGDSITDCGRMYDAVPAGWGSFGDGYVNLVNAFLTGLAPEKRIMVANKGVSGDNIVKMKARWEKDVFEMKPDYLSIMIGINDVWRHFDAILQQQELVDEEMFASVYEELVSGTLPRVKDIFIISPFMIEPNREDPMRKMVDAYAAIAKETAERHGLIYIDAQAGFDDFVTKLPGYTLSSDRVHPNVQGHMIVAKAFLDAIGFEWK